jgi:hypothetical protein
VAIDYHKLDDESRDKIVRELAMKLISHVCILCAKQFPTNAALENHFWDHTTDRFQLECLICGAAYISKDALLDHVRSHSQPRPPTPSMPVFKLSK